MVITLFPVVEAISGCYTGANSAPNAQITDKANRNQFQQGKLLNRNDGTSCKAHIRPDGHEVYYDIKGRKTPQIGANMANSSVQ